MINLATVYDVVSYVDDLESMPKAGAIGDGVAYTDTISSGLLVNSFSDTLIFVDVQVEGGSTIHVTISDTLMYVDQTSPFVKIGLMSEFIQLMDSFSVIPSLVDNLIFSDTLTATVGTGMTDIVTYTDSVSAIYGIGGRPISDTLVLSDWFYHYFNDPWRLTS